MSNSRAWLFRVLVLVVTAILLYSWFNPWWTAWVVVLKTTAVSIFPYGMKITMSTYAGWIAGADEVMPKWFTAFMWAYLGIITIGLISSLFISDTKKIGFGKINISLPTAIIATVGISYVIVCIAAVLTISANAPAYYGAELMGEIRVWIDDVHTSSVITGLKPAFWLACSSGLALIFLSVLRKFVVGKKQ
jgi:hypothetical protein